MQDISVYSYTRNHFIIIITNMGTREINQLLRQRNGGDSFIKIRTKSLSIGDSGAIYPLFVCVGTIKAKVSIIWLSWGAEILMIILYHAQIIVWVWAACIKGIISIGNYGLNIRLAQALLILHGVNHLNEPPQEWALGNFAIWCICLLIYKPKMIGGARLDNMKAIQMVLLPSSSLCGGRI